MDILKQITNIVRLPASLRSLFLSCNVPSLLPNAKFIQKNFLVAKVPDGVVRFSGSANSAEAGVSAISGRAANSWHDQLPMTGEHRKALKLLK